MKSNPIYSLPLIFQQGTDGKVHWLPDDPMSARCGVYVGYEATYVKYSDVNDHNMCLQCSRYFYSAIFRGVEVKVDNNEL